MQITREMVKEDEQADINPLTCLLKKLGKELVTIAGPCTIESQQDLSILEATALMNKKNKIIHALRGGAFKPRTSPNSFQGLREQGLEILLEAKNKLDLPIVSEIMDPRDIDLFLEMQVDILQVGSRNMQNYELLKELGKCNVPVLLKRGLAADFDEIKGAIGYLKKNNEDRYVLLCLRGLKKLDYGVSGIAALRDSIAGQRPEYRFFSDTEDIGKAKSIIAKMKKVFVGFDPSHVAGNEKYVREISESAIKNGADFLMTEVILSEDQRSSRQCDGKQAVTIENFKSILKSCRSLYSARMIYSSGLK